MLRALFARDFDRYFDLARAGERLWVFVHVPKTAGSSLIAEAEAILQPSFNIDIDHADTQRTYQVRFDEAVAAFVQQHAVTPFRFCTGHINARQVQVIRAGAGEVRCFTMLREPLARLVSDYRYQRSAMNTVQGPFVASTPDFEAYIDRKHVHNKMALNLVPRPLVMAGDVGACVDYITDNYAFVGLQEFYALGLSVLTTLMGDTRGPTAQVRVNSGDEDRVELTPDLRGRLEALNAIDLSIYAVFLQRWQAIEQELLAYMTGVTSAGVQQRCG